MNDILTGVRWLWSKIHRQRTCRSFHCHILGTLHNLPQLDWNLLPQINTLMGLWTANSWPIHARLCWEITPIFPTHSPSTSTICPTCMDTTVMWHKTTMYCSPQCIPKSQQMTNKKISTHHWSLLILWSCTLRNHVCCIWYPGCSTNSRYASHNQSLHQTTELCCNSPQHHALFPCQQWYNSANSLRCIITLQDKASRWAFSLWNDSLNSPINGTIHVYSSIMHSILYPLWKQR